MNEARQHEKKSTVPEAVTLCSCNLRRIEAGLEVR